MVTFQISIGCEVQGARERRKKSAGELTSDWNSSNAELSALVQHLAKLKDMCVAKAETCKEKVRRRTPETAGLSRPYPFCLSVRSSKSSDAPSGWRPALISYSCGRCPLLSQRLVKLKNIQTDVYFLSSATFHA